jgi:hypothetical protein
MPPGTTSLDVESWCDFAGPVYLLQPDPVGAIVVSVSFEGDDGDLSRQQERYADLVALRPS